MSGQLYEVLGDNRFVPLPVCPENLRGTKVSIKPSDGEAVQVDAEAACIAARVKSNLLAKGADAEIQVPVKRTTLNKVLEYMKYHQSTPPGDIPTPLISENLSECGATKWDVNYIAVDKNMLVELIYAASAMDIPTLGLLAKAKASTMMFGKTPEQIRKDFNFSNDLPKSEEAEITDMVRALRAKRNQPFEEELGLAPTAAIMGSVWRIAEGHIEAAASAAGGDELDARSWKRGSWRAAVAEDWRQLAQAPSELQQDRELLFASFRVSRGAALQHASPTLRADRDLVLAAVACGGESLKHAAPELRGDRDFVADALKVDGAALTGAADSLRSDRSLVLAACDAGQGSAMKGASGALRGDPDFVLQCAAKDVKALEHASEDLLGDKAFALSAIGKVRGALKHLPPRLKADKDIVEAALYHDPATVHFAHASRRSDREVPSLCTSNLKRVPHTGPRHCGVSEVSLGATSYATHKLQKSIVFTAMSTMTPNMGQSNYIAANSYMDKIPCMQRPEIDSLGIMWGTVGGMGMRWKAFASADFMNQTPDLLMGIDDACKVLHVIATKMDPPEWFAANYLDPQVRNMIIENAGKVGGWKPSEDAPVYPVIPARPAHRAAAVPPPRLTDGSREGEAALGAGGQGPAPVREAPSSKVREGEDWNAPLGGWPVLVGVGAEPMAEQEELPLEEGAMVELVGLKNKSGLTGTIVKCYAEGRYKVALDSKKGSALLKPEYLRVLAPAVACH